MTFFDRLEATRERWNVLEHPFYQRWSAGERTREELAVYAGQYRHAVPALAEAAASAARAAEPERVGSSPATAYFDLHPELDVEHAAAERALSTPP